MIEFNNSTLYISLRSPFARRVRLALMEHDIKFTEIVLDVFERNPDLVKINPLSRVPALVLADGQVLIDSSYILQAFYEVFWKSPLLPSTESQKLLNYKWSGIAVGVCEKTVEYYLEMLRPVENRDHATLSEIRDAFEGFFTEFESFIQNRTYVGGRQILQSDLDMASALEYLSLRYHIPWQSRYPETYRYLKEIGQRPSLRATIPPPS